MIAIIDYGVGNLLKNNLEMKYPDFPNGYGME